MLASEIYDILVNSPIAKNWIEYLERNGYDYGHIGCRIHKVQWQIIIEQELLLPGERVVYANVTCNSGIAGNVITDFGIRSKLEGKSQIFIKWKDITDISVKGWRGISIASRDNIIELRAGAEAEAVAFEELPRQIVKKIAAEKEQIQQAVLEIEKLRNVGEIEQAINKSLLFRFFTDGEVLYLQLVEYYFKMGEYQRVIDLANEYESLYVDNSSDFIRIELKKAESYLRLQEFNEAKNVIIDLSSTIRVDDMLEGKLLKDVIDGKFSEIVKSHRQTFKTAPYLRRKVMMVVPEYPKTQIHDISYFKVSDLPELQFPLGHPKNEELYIGYPNNPSKYIPYKDYQLTFLEDKISELCYLAQCLGATEISIDTLNSSEKEKVNQNENAFNGKFNIAGLKASGSKEFSSSKSILEKLNRRIMLKQTFLAEYKPFVPSGLVWFEDEHSWKMLVEQRMAGLDTYEIKIETEKSLVENASERNNIKAEVKALLGSAKGQYAEADESQFSLYENAVLSVKIKFAPLSELKKEPHQRPFLQKLKQMLRWR